VIRREKIGRNDPCPCGSGKKYKKCHGAGSSGAGGSGAAGADGGPAPAAPKGGGPARPAAGAKA
jgi:hypothetical protein